MVSSGMIQTKNLGEILVMCLSSVPSSAMNWNKGGPGVKRGFGFGGFSLAGKKEEPPLPQKSHTSFGATGSAGAYGKNQQLPSFYKIGTKRSNFDEENA